MCRPTLLRLSCLVLLLGLSATLSGVELSALPEVPAASGCNLENAGSLDFLGGPFQPLCPATNDEGCSFSDIACAGFNCCCIYACPGGSGAVGPCFQL